MGGLLALIAAGFAWIAADRGGPWLMLSWPAAAFGSVAAGYLALGPRVFGKRADGSRRAPAAALLLPYSTHAAAIWHLARFLSRESVFDELCDGVRIGRRVLAHELPVDTVTVLDLTCEFVEPRGIRSADRSYRTVPILDRLGTEPDQLALIARTIAESPGPVYVHCAQGHGRTAMAAAAFLLAAGRADSVAAALADVRAARPLAIPSRSQRRALDELVRTLANAPGG